MKILAIDPAATCGWAIADGGEYAASGTWDLSTRRDESAGMKLLRLESKLVEVAKAGVGLVVYETPALHTPHRLALVSHAKFVGVIERFCTRRSINYRGYAPTEIKKHITGKGNAKKPDVVACIVAKGYTPADDNEADAIALMLLALSEYGTEVPF